MAEGICSCGALSYIAKSDVLFADASGETSAWNVSAGAICDADACLDLATGSSCDEPHAAKTATAKTAAHTPTRYFTTDVSLQESAARDVQSYTTVNTDLLQLTWRGPGAPASRRRRASKHGKSEFRYATFTQPLGDNPERAPKGQVARIDQTCSLPARLGSHRVANAEVKTAPAPFLKSAKCRFEPDWGHGGCAGRSLIGSVGPVAGGLHPGVTPASGRDDRAANTTAAPHHNSIRVPPRRLPAGPSPGRLGYVQGMYAVPGCAIRSPPSLEVGGLAGGRLLDPGPIHPASVGYSWDSAGNFIAIGRGPLHCA